MHKNTALLAGLAAVTVLALPALGRPKAKAAPAASGQTASFADDLEKLTETLELTKEQQAKLTDLKAQRDAALAKWDGANQKQIAAIGERMKKLTGRGGARTKAQLQRQLEVLRSGRERLAATHERDLFAVLTRSQRGKYNGPILADAVLREFRSLKLTDEQTKKVQELCLARGETVNAPLDPKLHEATFKAVKQQAATSVLTPAQRREYAKSSRSSSGRTSSKSSGRKSSR